MSMEFSKEAVRSMLGKVWDAQVDLLVETGALTDPSVMMPPRWAEVPEPLKSQVARAVTPAIGLFNQVMHEVVHHLRSGAN